MLAESPSLSRCGPLWHPLRLLVFFVLKSGFPTRLFVDSLPLEVSCDGSHWHFPVPTLPSRAQQLSSGRLCHGRSVKPSSIGANKWQSLSRALCIALGDRVCRMPLACRMAPIVRLARAEASLQKLCVRHPLQQSRARVRPLRDLMGRSGNRSRFHRRLSVPVRPVGLAFVQTGLPSRRPWPMPGFQPPLALPCWVLR